MSVMYFCTMTQYNEYTHTYMGGDGVQGEGTGQQLDTPGLDGDQKIPIGCLKIGSNGVINTVGLDSRKCLEIEIKP